MASDFTGSGTAIALSVKTSLMRAIDFLTCTQNMEAVRADVPEDGVNEIYHTAPTLLHREGFGIFSLRAFRRICSEASMLRSFSRTYLQTQIV